MAAAALKASALPSAIQNHQGFSGDVLPQEAVDFLSQHGGVLIDVRTRAEWQFVGTPKVDAPARLALIEWKTYPQFSLNPEFINQLRATGVSTDTPLFFICKTGGRSTDAAIAATAAGFSNCYNIAGGFEGEPDARGQRSRITGWRAAGLAWEQQ